jgi:hypothetical protein
VSALKLESESLNSQLVKQREANGTLTESFNRYEQDLLTLSSMKNGEIADLKQAAADKTLEAAAYKGIAWSRLIIIIALAGYFMDRFYRLQDVPVFQAFLILTIITIIINRVTACFIINITGGICGNSKIRIDGGGNICIGYLAFLRRVPSSGWTFIVVLSMITSLNTIPSSF